jgi:cytochrome b561
MKEDAPARYHPLHVAVHWTMAILVLSTIAYVMPYLDDVPNDAAKVVPYSVHVATGAILVVLLVARLYLRLKMPKPVPADAEHTARNLIAKIVHFLLYVGMAGMLFIGYALFSAANMTEVLRGDGPFPQDFHAFPMREVHGAVGYTLLLIILLHFGAAMYHQFIRKDNQYFTKAERIPENKGADVRPHPCFRASPGRFVIY